MKTITTGLFLRPEAERFQILPFNQKLFFLFSILLLMFLMSGAAALIYEVVWFELLEIVIGSSAFSLAILLSVYMGGLFLGSLLLLSFPQLI